MEAPDETAVDEAAAPLTLAERLGRFLHEAYLSAGEAGLAQLNSPQSWDELEPGMRNVSVYIAEQVIRNFLRLDNDARAIYAISGVDNETLQPFAAVHWGALFGRVNPDELRSIGHAFVEVAEQSELEASMARWLSREDGSTIDGVAKIIASFRVFRAELDATPEPMPGE